MSYINKEAAIDLIESMIADKGVAFNPHKLAMALKGMESVEIPEAQDTDLISRQAAIELACWRCKKCEKKDCEYKDSCETMKLLDALPSEDPKPPMLNNDCISRQQAVEAVTNTIREKFSLADWYEQLVETGLEIENLIKELPPVTPTEKTGEWIPTSERLPKAEDMYQPPEQRYLCQLEAYGERKFCVLSRLKGAISPFWDWYGVAVHDSEVIAWMPLPEPYGEDGEDE